MQPVVCSKTIRRTLVCLALFLPTGCSRQAAVTGFAHSELSEIDPYAAGGAIVVPADRQWVDTGVDLAAGDPLTVVARGQIAVGDANSASTKRLTPLGPEGTYIIDDEVASRRFPLPTGADGPAPAFCLIGRIGNGPPFHVGKHKSWTADRTGRLWLGTNDFEFTDNDGQLYANVTRAQLLQPVSFEQAVSPDDGSGKPHSDCSVVVFYIPGLRPDVVREMAAMDHLPNIRRIFVDGGTWLSNFVSPFPSDTVSSASALWTGCYSDRHGLKGPVEFSRRRLYSRSLVEPLSSTSTARLLAPSGVDRIVSGVGNDLQDIVTLSVENARSSGAYDFDVPPISEQLWSLQAAYRRTRMPSANRKQWASGVLPLVTQAPPALWTRSLAQVMPYLQAQNSWKYLDEANVHYTMRYLLPSQAAVTVIWMPETDAASRRFSRGQFGSARRNIVEADALIGRIVKRLQSEGRLDRTYLALVSSHGHHGGRATHLTHFDLVNELFYKPREVSPDGKWIGGGLGLSVRQHRFWNRHPEDTPLEFVFVEGVSSGVARVFLPRRNFRSGDWKSASRPGDLLAYRIAEHLPALDLVESLLATRATRGDGRVGRPIDLVLLKLSESSILIATADRGQAVIERRRNDRGKWVYRYTPVENVRATPTGRIAYRAARRRQHDPLELGSVVPAHRLEQFHDASAWLEMSVETRYPDSVVALATHMLWQKELREREMEFAPDLVVTARPGWFFGTTDTPGSLPGYPLHDAMRCTLFVAGPNVRQGARIDKPCRVVDLAPTILDMVGVPFNADSFDGSALRCFYESDRERLADTIQPIHWYEVDLDAWHPLVYRPIEAYEHMPRSVNRPGSFFDLNNIAYNALSVADLSVLRIVEDAIEPLAPGDQRLTEAFDAAEQRLRDTPLEPLAGVAHVLDVPGVALADYSATSQGNLKRYDRAIDWLQQQSRAIDQGVAARVGRKHLPGSPVAHASIDNVQWLFWQAYGTVQGLFYRVLDVTILNTLENGTDRAINTLHGLPAEIVVDPRGRRASRATSGVAAAARPETR